MEAYLNVQIELNDIEGQEHSLVLTEEEAISLHDALNNLFYDKVSNVINKKMSKK